ncbi:TetR/AcrR family transcriptional regulator [Micromonospora sp. NPDC049275]|uniref:TetR/AcrR family transcriptional regulator n=1 Tax=Micromonospora sp. NPDC049275 TaxID=3364268 RepID=UPI00371C8B7E
MKAATEATARDGAYASLEEIARSAGVGSATLHRHFPSRWSLLQAVFQTCVRNLAGRAEDLLAEPDALTALTTWLREVTVYATTTRGLAGIQPPGRRTAPSRWTCIQGRPVDSLVMLEPEPAPLEEDPCASQSGPPPSSSGSASAPRSARPSGLPPSGPA